MPIKHIVETPVTDGPHETPVLYETGIPFLSAEAVKDGVLDFNFKRGYISLKDHDRFKKKISPKKDDIFIVKSGATTGNVGIVNTDEIFDIWSPLALIRCNKTLAIQKYIYFYLLSTLFKSQVEFNWSFGTQQNIGMGVIERIKVILPPVSEQQKIVEVLDKKTAQLDKVKALLEEQIQKLKDYRDSLIYETVTKGLDKTVPLKDSGIDWIGQVPQGWGVGKVKYFSQISAGATPDRNNSLFWNGNINWMSSGEVNQGIVKHTFETITDLALKRTSTKLLPNGTVMLALNGQGKTKGTAAVLAIESASNQSLASFIVDNKILNNMYLYYFFVANYYNIRGLKGEDRDGLNLQLVSNIVIPLFELEEQQKLVDFLDKKTVQIDKLIQIKNEQIDNINKQRQTLIYDYVTGKRRV
ncbi:MAG: restriction endonuclease subunit S [Lachnospiraceae bacterium oral taxon 082]|nr:restriction endonuclease subunit S [Lachnospiraceae bacterium oral taxon 082]